MDEKANSDWNISKTFQKLNEEDNHYAKTSLIYSFFKRFLCEFGEHYKGISYLNYPKEMLCRPNLKSFRLIFFFFFGFDQLTSHWAGATLSPSDSSTSNDIWRVLSVWNLIANRSWWYCINGSIIQWKRWPSFWWKL